MQRVEGGALHTVNNVNSRCYDPDTGSLDWNSDRVLLSSQGSPCVPRSGAGSWGSGVLARIHADRPGTIYTCS